MDEHRESLGFDLLNIAGKQIDDIGDSLSWRSLYSFIYKLDYKSELVKEVNPDAKELSYWGDALKTNLILADIYDMLAMINANLVAVGSRKASKKPKRYPRPKALERKNEEKRHIGKDALPVNELEKWFEERRNKAKWQE